MKKQLFPIFLVSAVFIVFFFAQSVTGTGEKKSTNIDKKPMAASGVYSLPDSTCLKQIGASTTEQRCCKGVPSRRKFGMFYK